MEAVPHIEVDVYEPLTASKSAAATDFRKDARIFLHLYETCPAVRHAVARDGEVMTSRGFLDEVLAREPQMPLCGQCAIRLNANSGCGLGWQYERQRQFIEPR